MGCYRRSRCGSLVSPLYAVNSAVGLIWERAMTMTLVGTVRALWRYPVKSMLGEWVEELVLTERGFWGDRAYALWDDHIAPV
jgi:hypothetical protein